MLGALSDRKVLDLFAGSGALGIEALSRGAASAVFVDRDPRAVACVRRNLAALGIDAPVHRQEASAFLTRTAAQGARFDLALLDPPYSSAHDLGRRLSERLPAVLDDDAMIVSESDKRHPLELDLPLLRERVYGDTRIAFHGVR